MAVPAAVIDPLFHDGVIRVQVDRHVLVLRVEHVAELLQPAVLWAAAGGVPQVVHDVGHKHFTCLVRRAAADSEISKAWRETEETARNWTCRKTQKNLVAKRERQHHNPEESRY